MTTNTKLIIAASAALAVGIVIASMYSNARIGSLERNIDTAKQKAKDAQNAANDVEMQSAEYKRKIEYLESQLAGIAGIARRQDEELEKITANTNAARRDVERARGIRTIDTTTDELCRKLAGLGHACRQE